MNDPSTSTTVQKLGPCKLLVPSHWPLVIPKQIPGDSLSLSNGIPAISGCSPGAPGARFASLASEACGKTSRVLPRREETQSLRLKLARLQAVSICKIRPSCVGDQWSLAPRGKGYPSLVGKFSSPERRLCRGELNHEATFECGFHWQPSLLKRA